MKKIALLLFSSVGQSAHAQLDRAGNVIESGNGGPVTIWSLVAVVLFFGGLFWFMSRFKRETEGYVYLMAAVFVLIVASCVFK